MRRSVISLGLAALFVLIWPATALAQGVPINMGASDPFAVLGGTDVTNTGPTVITGPTPSTTTNALVGVSPGTSIVGFPPGASGVGCPKPRPRLLPVLVNRGPDWHSHPYRHEQPHRSLGIPGRQLAEHRS